MTFSCGKISKWNSLNDITRGIEFDWADRFVGNPKTLVYGFNFELLPFQFRILDPCFWPSDQFPQQQVFHQSLVSNYYPLKRNHKEGNESKSHHVPQRKDDSIQSKAWNYLHNFPAACPTVSKYCCADSAAFSYDDGSSTSYPKLPFFVSRLKALKSKSISFH